MTIKEGVVLAESLSSTPAGVFVIEIFAVRTLLSVGSDMVNLVFSGIIGGPSCM